MPAKEEKCLPREAHDEQHITVEKSQWNGLRLEALIGVDKCWQSNEGSYVMKVAFIAMFVFQVKLDHYIDYDR